MFIALWFARRFLHCFLYPQVTEKFGWLETTSDQTSTFEVQVSLWWVHDVCGRSSHECLVTLRSFRLPHDDLWTADAGDPQKCKSWPAVFSQPKCAQYPLSRWYLSVYSDEPLLSRVSHGCLCHDHPYDHHLPQPAYNFFVPPCHWEIGWPETFLLLNSVTSKVKIN